MHKPIVRSGSQNFEVIKFLVIKPWM